MFRTFFGAGSATYHFNDHNSLTFQAAAFHTKEQETYDITGQYWLNELDPSGEDEEAEDTGETIGVGTYMEHARNYLNADVQSYSLTGKHQVKRHAIQWGLELKKERIKDKLREWELRDSAGYSLPQVPDGPELIYSMSSKNDISSSRMSLYAQDSYKFKTNAGIFTLSASLRGS